MSDSEREQNMEKKDMQPLRNELIGALVGLARAVQGNEDLVSEKTVRLGWEGLSAASAYASSDRERLSELIDLMHEEKARLVPDCARCQAPCGRNNDYDISQIGQAKEDIRSLKSLILFGICTIAFHNCRTPGSEFKEQKEGDFLFRALRALGEEWQETAALLPLIMEMGELSRRYLYPVS